MYRKYKPFHKGIVYDGVDLGDLFDINEIRVELFPPVSINAVKVPTKSGTRFSSLEFGERQIYMNLSIKGFKRDLLHLYNGFAQFLCYLIKEEPKELKLGNNRYIKAVVTEVSEIQKIGERGIIEATFVANDPIFYGEEKKIQLKAGTNNLYITGQQNVYPIFEITGTTDISITNYKTGEKIHVPSCKSANKYVIDCEHWQCTTGNTYVPVDMENTDFFELPYGDADLRLTSGNGTLTYRERFL